MLISTKRFNPVSPPEGSQLPRLPSDPWLERWLPLIREHAGGSAVLELGCGTGVDTKTLVDAGLSVLATDISAEAIAQAMQVAPAAVFSTQDVRHAFPVGLASTGVILASLSLHYFPWRDTQQIFERIAKTLMPDGLFLCRLNSTDDVHFGARGYPELEPDLFLVDGQPKRFFTREAIEKLIGSTWQVHSLEPCTTGKYGKPKALWELACTKSAV